jgi:hypothetical protein
MAKTRKNNKRKIKESAARPSREEVIADNEKREDFGGIPRRDLKKNLGCG